MSVPARFVRRQTSSQSRLHFLFDVKAELVVEVALDPGQLHDGPDARPSCMQGRHQRPTKV
jgi:hypothetical protein